MQTTSYTLHVRGKAIKKNQITGLHIMLGLLFLFIGILSLAGEAARPSENASVLADWWVFGFGGLLLIISIFFNKKILQVRELNYTLRLLEFVTLLLILIYSYRHQFFLQFTYIGTALIALVLTTVWEKRSEKFTPVILDSEGIRIGHFLRPRKLNWSEIQRVIFKHGILTIDCRNDRLFQYPVSAPLSPLDREALEFAERSIREHAHAYRGDW